MRSRIPALLSICAAVVVVANTDPEQENANVLVARQSGKSSEAPTSGSGSSVTPTGCPTVTLTSALCPSCTVPACEEIRPLTQLCGCPSAIPTVFVSFACNNGGDSCAGLGCNPTYAIFTQTECASTTSTGTASTSSGAVLSTPIITATTETGGSTWTSTITSSASSGGNVVVVTEIGNYNFTSTLTSTVGWRNLTTSTASNSTATITTGSGGTAAKTASTTSSTNGAMRLQPFWAMWL